MDMSEVLCASEGYPCYDLRSRPDLPQGIRACLLKEALGRTHRKFPPHAPSVNECAVLESLKQPWLE